jgi:hypothetical protein
MKAKLVSESLYEFEQSAMSDKQLNERFQQLTAKVKNGEQLNEEELYELQGLKKILGDVASAVKNVAAPTGKQALDSFFKQIEGKDDVDDQIINNAFANVFNYGFTAKYPKTAVWKEKSPVETKFKMLKKAKEVADKNANFTKFFIDPNTKAVGGVALAANAQPGLGN